MNFGTLSIFLEIVCNSFESALKIQQQALADNFTLSDIQIVGKNYQDPNRFNLVNNSKQCEVLP